MNLSDDSLGPLTIEIGGPGSSPYKSIVELKWDSVPPLAVLMGLNGGGKSQLLELLARKLTGEIEPTKVSIAGDQFQNDEVAFVPTAGIVSGYAISPASLRQATDQIYQVACNGPQ